MPELSLVVCIYRERDLLARLLERTDGCYDDLVVVHDGPDDTDVRSLVEQYGGRFFERPRHYAHEAHWAFAWAQARNDWILRWDADEYPSAALKDWIRAFRAQPEPPADISGFTCVWPLWDGRRARTKTWPRRIFLINRQRVRHFAVAHQPPIPDGRLMPLGLVLEHQPKQKNYGLRYTLKLPKVRHWQDHSARALLGKPTDLPCWRWDSPDWPDKWEQIRQRPLRTAIRRLLLSPIWNSREMIAHGQFPWPSLVISFPLQHWMTCMSYRKMLRRTGKQARP